MRMVTGALFCRGYSWLVIALSLLLLSPSAFAQQDSPTSRHIIIIHSYNVDFDWTNDIDGGIRETLEDSGYPLVIHTEYMDTKFLHTPEHLAQLKELYTAKYAHVEPDVVINSDDNALRFLLANRDSLFPGVPLVFCGINCHQGELYLQDELLEGCPDVTGVVEQVDIASNIELIRQLHPDVQRILIFVDDSTTSQLNLANARQAIAGIDGGIEFVIHNDLGFEQVLQLAPTWGRGDVRLECGTLKNSNGAVIPHPESCAALSAASSIPTYGCWTYLLGNGAIGGKMLDGRSQGKAAAHKALQILAGTPAGEVPVEYTSPNPLIFDNVQLKAAGIRAGRLPAGSIVLNRPEPFFPAVSATCRGVHRSPVSAGNADSCHVSAAPVQAAQPAATSCQ